MTFKENIIGAFGAEGKIWLSKLPKTINALQDYWKLQNIKPVENMTYHYIVKAVDEKSAPVILKVGCNRQLIQNEAYLLNHFDGHGAIRLIDHNLKYNALLLQQAIPGITLKSFYPQKIKYVIDRYVDTVNKLHSINSPDHFKFKHIEDWLKALNHADQIPNELIKKAIALRDKMLSSMKEVKLLHGDLHLDNILKNGEEWVVIDPQGVFGELEFEVAAFDFIDANELANASKEMFLDRVGWVADKFDLSFERVRNWIFIRLVLSAAWFIEDKGDPEKALTLAQLISP